MQYVEERVKEAKEKSFDGILSKMRCMAYVSQNEIFLEKGAFI